MKIVKACFTFAIMLSDILHAQQVLLLFKKRGVQHIVISPGSRNAPLTISFTNDSYFKCYSIVDERCASHFAMGIAQQLKQPVAVVCTSGSALLNYYPAVTEAFYSEIPLIVLSADRPPHKIDIGDGQTIRQQNVYANHILYDTHLEMINGLDDQEAMATNERLINKAINVAITNQGPVHINIPFEEPLYNTVKVAQVDPKVIEPSSQNNASIPALFADRWEKANRKLVILSTLNPHVFTQEQLSLLTSDPTVLVMSEVSSNITHENIIWGIDTLIAPIEKDEEAITHLQPDMVVTIGGMIVSKKIKQYLRRFETQYHYHIGNRRAYDTFFKLAGHIKTAPSHWVDQLSIIDTTNSYRDYWLKFFKDYLIKRTNYLTTIPWSDFRAFNLIFDSLPDDIVLQLGNSSTIRYAQLFPMNPTHTVFSNRGTSGIDGSTSTAIGAAVAQDKPTICITGDLSFLYDSNALWNNHIPANFKIIVINNSGGGIFRILPGEKDNTTFDTYFETTHQLDASHLCKMYALGYHRVDGEDAYAKAYEKFLNDNSRPQLLEIFTPRLENDTVLLDYFKFLK